MKLPLPMGQRPYSNVDPLLVWTDRSMTVGRPSPRTVRGRSALVARAYAGAAGFARPFPMSVKPLAPRPNTTAEMTAVLMSTLYPNGSERN